jgi:hypothetical protein
MRTDAEKGISREQLLQAEVWGAVSRVALAHELNANVVVIGGGVAKTLAAMRRVWDYINAN